jgi:nucleoside-diphosphate kinase
MGEFLNMKEQTLSIIKPDAVEKNQIGKILSYLEKEELKIVGAKMLRLSKKMAEEFYAVHKSKSFFDSLVTFMCSGPILVTVLEGEKAVERNRKVMGATDFQKAEAGTIRRDFASSIERNAVHGSDSLENAAKEIAFFFKKEEILSR